jgi:hypothetical protein
MSGATQLNFTRMFGIPQTVMNSLKNFAKIKTPKGSLGQTENMSFGTTEDELMKINSNISNSETKTNIIVEVAQERIVITPKSSRNANMYSPLSKIFNPISISMKSPSPTSTNSSVVRLGLRKTVSSRTVSEPNYMNVNTIKKGKRDVKILYPIFYHCVKLINDEFWINILLNCSTGKFKKGFSYRENYLIYKNKEKIFIDQANPLNALNQLQYFLKTKAGIMSEIDRLNENTMAQQILEKDNEDKIEQWSDIKNNNFRNILIERYIFKVKNYYNLNDNELLRLKNLIYVSLILGDVGNENIQIQSNNIISISNLNFNENDRTFNIDNNGRTGKAKKYNKSSVKENSKNKFLLNKSLNDIIKFLDKKNNKQITENEKMESMLSHMNTSANISSERANTSV